MLVIIIIIVHFYSAFYAIFKGALQLKRLKTIKCSLEKTVFRSVLNCSRNNNDCVVGWL